MLNNKVKKIIEKIITVTFVSMVFTMIATGSVKAEVHYLHDETISVDGGAPKVVRAVDCEYRNNEYVSLKDMAELLKDTPAAFSVEITDGSIAVVTKRYAAADGGEENAVGEEENTEGEAAENVRELTGWKDEERSAFRAGEVATNSFSVNGDLKKYFNLRASYQQGTDCFIRPLNLCMILNINMVDTGNNTFSIDTGSILQVAPKQLEEDGYFDEVSTVLAGDATTGEIFYEYKGDNVFPVASITKLMTYLLTQEAIERGEFTEDDYVTISEGAAEIAASGDGSTGMRAGGQITVKELIIGTLLPSSNECAYLLGEKVSGDADTFVKLMNDRAAELGMTTAHFNNPNGLPSYSDSAIPSKRQNNMSAKDLFKLCSYILENYPRIKEVTSLRTAPITALGFDAKNTNALLYNMPEVNGLKTGTTDSAGACLVTSLTVNDGTSDHDLVVILLGGENTRVRFTTSELLAYYAKNVVLGNLTAQGVVKEQPDEGEEIQTITADSIVNMVVEGAFKLQGSSNG